MKPADKHTSGALTGFNARKTKLQQTKLNEVCVPGNADPSHSATVCHSDDFYITRTKEEHHKNKEQDN